MATKTIDLADLQKTVGGKIAASTTAARKSLTDECRRYSFTLWHTGYNGSDVQTTDPIVISVVNEDPDADYAAQVGDYIIVPGMSLALGPNLSEFWYKAKANTPVFQLVIGDRYPNG